MGFIDFANSGLQGAEDFPDSGNLGLLDIMEALRWIKKNISAFGGDPQNVTLFGNSSGASSIALIMSMPESAGLFQKAITESGAVSMTSGVEDCKPLTAGLIKSTGATSMSQLMALSSSELLTLAENLKGLTNFPERDEIHIAANPYEAFAQNSTNFEIMAGTMADEVNYWALGLGAETFAEFIPLAFYQIAAGISAVNSDDGAIPETFVAEYMSEHEDATELEAMSQFLNDLLFRVPVLTELENFAGSKYLYYWTYPSGIPGLGACHSLEVPYVLNLPAVFVPFLFDKDLAADVQELWVNFAKSGRPSASWPSYDTTTRATMIVDEAFDVSNGHLAERFALVSPLIKYGISGQALINIANTPSESEDTEPQDDSESQATNNPGSSGGGCNAGVATYALAGLVLFIVRKKS
jgi:para-nitrobenzyl esterase